MFGYAISLSPYVFLPKDFKGVFKPHHIALYSIFEFTLKVFISVFKMRQHMHIIICDITKKNLPGFLKGIVQDIFVVLTYGGFTF